MAIIFWLFAAFIILVVSMYFAVRSMRLVAQEEAIDEGSLPLPPQPKIPGLTTTEDKVPAVVTPVPMSFDTNIEVQPAAGLNSNNEQYNYSDSVNTTQAPAGQADAQSVAQALEKLRALQQSTSGAGQGNGEDGVQEWGNTTGTELPSIKSGELTVNSKQPQDLGTFIGSIAIPKQRFLRP